jgi:hypothetical protein
MSKSICYQATEKGVKSYTKWAKDFLDFARLSYGSRSWTEEIVFSSIKRVLGEKSPFQEIQSTEGGSRTEGNRLQ